MRLSSLFAFAAFAAGAAHASSVALLPNGAVDVMRETAQLRAAWVASHGAMPPDGGRATTLVHGAVLKSSLNVVVAPAAPAVMLQYKTDSSGLSQVEVGISGPGNQSLFLLYSPPAGSTAGTLVLQQPDGFSNGFGGSGQLTLYSAPGTWAVDTVVLIASDGNSGYYNGSELAAVFKKSSFTVTNDVSPDVTPPTVSRGMVQTRTVSLSAASPTFSAVLRVADDVSGVASASLTLTPPANGGDVFPVYASTDLSAPIMDSKVVTTAVFQTTGPFAAVPGKWTISGYSLCDVASNCVYDNTPADVKALLGTDTFEVTN